MKHRPPAHRVTRIVDLCQYGRIDIMLPVGDIPGMAKTAQLQIRVTPQEKVRLKHLARSAGQDVSSYVLARALPAGREHYERLMRALVRGEDRRYALAELHDLLAGAPRALLHDVVGSAPPATLPPDLRNYIAAMVEHAAALKQVDPPAWVGTIASVPDPYFPTSLRNLWPYLLQVSPVAFKRRNIFVDAAVGDRV